MIYFLFLPFAFCDEGGSEPVVCNGDDIEYFEGNKRLRGRGNIRLTYQDMELFADAVEVDLETKEAVASGNVVLKQGENVFKAESILYDFRSKKGKLAEVRMEAPPWYGKCDRIDKVADTEYVLGRGYISTCDCIPPHYKIRTRQARLYLGDKIEARNVVICAGNIPVMYLPSYTHNVKNKKPMVAIVPGHSKDWGYYNLAAFRYNLSEEQAGKLHFDVRDKKGIASGITHNYCLDFSNSEKDMNLGKGIFDIYYMNEDDKNKPEGRPREKERYRVCLRHKWGLGPKTDGLLEYNRLSDKDFIKDYFYRQEYINEVQPKTYVSLIHSQEHYSATFLCQGRVNPFFTETQYLPQVSFEVKNQRLFEKLPLYYKSEYSAANISKKNAGTNDDDDANRLDSYNEISYVFSPFGSLCLNPCAGTRQNWYSKDKFDSGSCTRGIFYSGIDASTNFSRIYDLQTKVAGTQVNALRHIITPLVSYEYIHGPSFSGDRLAGFDDLETIAQKNMLTFTLENNFQTKTFDNSDTKTNGSYQTMDLARFLLSTGYNFQKIPGGELTDITGSFEFTPSGKLLIRSDAGFDAHSLQFNTVNFDFVANSSDGAKFGLGHRYQKAESSEMTMDVSYPLTPKLGMHCYGRYQFHESDLQEQEYGISYDLHCWLMDINFNHCDGSTIWVVFRLKAFPDFPIQLGSTYQRPKPETI